MGDFQPKDISEAGVEDSPLNFLKYNGSARHYYSLQRKLGPYPFVLTWTCLAYSSTSKGITLLVIW